MTTTCVALVVWVSSSFAFQEAAPPKPALRGLDPVELVAGREVAGDPAYMEDRNGFRYAFVSEENAEEFEARAKRYEIQLGGGCGSMGPLSGQGDPERFLVHDGRIYIFASDACRDSFQKAPEKYVEREEFPLDVDSHGEKARGQVLLARILADLGGAERVDALGNLRIANASVRKNGDKDSVWRQERVYDFASPQASAGDEPGHLLRTEAWDDWVWREELQAALRSGVQGKEQATMGWAARHEFEVQMSRELLFLLRRRQNAFGFSAWAAGSADVNGQTLERLVVYWNGRNTTLFVAESGRVLRMSWYGRLTSGRNGEVVVDFADFEALGGLVLPRSRQVRFDGQLVDYLSGRLAELSVNTPPATADKR